MAVATVEATCSYKVDGEKVEENLTNERIQEEVKVPNELSADQVHNEVSYSEGETVKVANFEFLRVDVGLKICTKLSIEAIEDGFEFATEWVKQRRESQVVRLLEDLRK
mgnify:CR=1 FL=1